MREIPVEKVTELVKELCIRANYRLTEDVKAAFSVGREQEASPLGKTIFDKMLKNCLLAEQKNMPVCQDTGMAVVYAEIGQEVHLIGGLFSDAVNEGIRQGYMEGYLRCSIVGDPLRRENTNDNTPGILYIDLVPGDKIRITVAPKGFGSENMSCLHMFTPAATREDIINFVVSACDKAGSNPCPPIIVGVGLGGTSEKAAYLAKKALIRGVNQSNPDPFYAEMEQMILTKVNQLGIGPQGLGGTVSALSVAVEAYPTHIAGLPCAVNIGCHVTRHADGEI